MNSPRMDSTIRLSVDPTELRKIMEEQASRVKFTPAGSELDKVFKEILQVRSGEVEKALGKLATLNAQLLESATQFESIAKYTTGSSSTEAKRVADISRMTADKVGNLITRMSKGQETFVQSDIQSLVTQIRASSNSLLKLQNTNLTKSIISNNEKMQNMLSPGYTDEMRILYGQNEKARAVIDKFGKAWSQFFNFEDKLAALKDVEGKLGGKLGKTEGYTKLQGLGKELGERLDDIKIIFRSTIDKYVSGEIKDISHLERDLDSMLGRGSAINKGTSYLKKYGQVTSKTLAKIEENDKAYWEKRSTVWDAVREQEMKGKLFDQSYIREYFGDMGILKPVKKPHAGKSDLDIYNVRETPEQAAQRQAIVTDQAHANEELKGRASILKNRVKDILDTYGDILKGNGDIKSRLEKFISTNYSTGKERSAYPLDVLTRGQEVLESITKEAASPLITKERQATLNVQYQKQVGKIPIGKFETEVDNYEKELQRQQQSYERTTEANRRFREIISQNVIGGFGGGGKGSGFLGSGIHIDDTVKNIIENIKTSGEEYNTLKGTVGGIRANRPEFEKLMASKGLPGKEATDIILKNLTAMMAPLEKDLQLRKSSDVIAESIAEKERNITNAIKEREALRNKVTDIDKQQATSPIFRKIGYDSVAQNALKGQLQKDIDRLTTGVIHDQEKKAVDPSQKIIDGIKKARDEYDQLGNKIKEINADRQAYATKEGMSLKDVDTAVNGLERQRDLTASTLDKEKTREQIQRSLADQNTVIKNKLLEQKVVQDDIAKIEEKLKTTTDPKERAELTAQLKARESTLASINSLTGTQKTQQEQQKSALKEIENIQYKIGEAEQKRLVYKQRLAELKPEIDSGRASIAAQAEYKNLSMLYDRVGKGAGIAPDAIDAQTKVNMAYQEGIDRIRQAKAELTALQQKRVEIGQKRGLMPEDEYKAQVKWLDQSIKMTEDLSKGYLKSLNPIKRLGDGLTGIVRTMKDLAEWQSVWYASKFFIMGIPQVIGFGIEYAKALDEWTVKMLRWGATSGQVTDKMKGDIGKIGTELRKTVLDVPIKFEVAAEATSGLLGAGLDPNTVKNIVRDISILKASFPEINMEAFSVATVGAFNTFRDSIQGATTDAGKFRIILEQLLRAQAESIVRPEQFTKVMQYMSAMGKISGFATEEIFALSTTLADTGITAQSSSRLLASFMAQLSRPIAQKGMRQLGIDINENASAATNLTTIMRKLSREMQYGGEGAPQKYLSYFQKFIPKEELKILFTLADRWDEYQKRIKSLKGSEGALGPDSSLLATMKGSITGQLQLLHNTLREVGSFGDSTKNIFAEAVKTGLDATRGALLALNPELAKTKFGLESLDGAGRALYQTVSSMKSVMSALLVVPKLLGGPLLDLISLFTKLQGVLEVIANIITVKLLGKLWTTQFAPLVAAGKNKFMSGMANAGFVGVGAASPFTSPVRNAPTGGLAGAINEHTNSLLVMQKGTPIAEGVAGGMTKIGMAGAKLKGVFSGLLNVFGPLNLALAGGIFLWSKYSQANEEVAQSLKDIKEGLSSTSNSLKDLTNVELNRHIQKLQEAIDKQKEFSLWELWKRAVSGPEAIGPTKTETEKDLNTRYDARIETLKEKLNEAEKDALAEGIDKSGLSEVPVIAGILAEIKRQNDLRNEAIKKLHELKTVSPVDMPMGAGNIVSTSISAYKWITGNNEKRYRAEELKKYIAEQAKAEKESDAQAARNKKSVTLTLPDEEVKQFGTQRAALIRQNQNIVFQMIKGYYDTLREIEETNQKLGLVGVEEHWRRRSEAISRELDIELKEEKESYANQLNALKSALEDEKRKELSRASGGKRSGRDPDGVLWSEGAINDLKEEIDRKHRLTIENATLQHLNKLREILKKNLSGQLSEWVKFYEERLKLEDTYNKLLSSFKQSEFDKLKESLTTGIDIKDTVVKDLWNSRKISAKEYYDWVEQKAIETAVIEEATADRTFEKWRDDNKIRIDQAKGVFTTLSKLREQGAMPVDTLSDNAKKQLEESIKLIKDAFTNEKMPIPEGLASDKLQVNLEWVFDENKVKQDTIKIASITAEELDAELSRDNAIYSSREKLRKQLIDTLVEEQNSIEYLWGTQGGIAKVIGKTLEELGAKYRNWAQNVADATTGIMSGMESALTNFFDDTSEKFMKGKDLMKDISATIKKELMKTMVVKPIMGMVTGGLEGIIKPPEQKQGNVENYLSKILEELKNIGTISSTAQDKFDAAVKEKLGYNPLENVPLMKIEATNVYVNDKLLGSLGGYAGEKVESGSSFSEDWRDIGNWPVAKGMLEKQDVFSKSNSLDIWREAIASIEADSRGYGSLGKWVENKKTDEFDRAYGRYQVMGKNIGPWTQAAGLGRMTSEQFLNDPAAQDTVFNYMFGKYLEKYGNLAPVAWQGGPGAASDIQQGKMDVWNRTDTMTKISEYQSKAQAAYKVEALKAGVYSITPEGGVTPVTTTSIYGSSPTEISQNLAPTGTYKPSESKSLYDYLVPSAGAAGYTPPATFTGTGSKALEKSMSDVTTKFNDVGPVLYETLDNTNTVTEQSTQTKQEEIYAIQSVTEMLWKMATAYVSPLTPPEQQGQSPYDSEKTATSQYDSESIKKLYPYDTTRGTSDNRLGNAASTVAGQFGIYGQVFNMLGLGSLFNNKSGQACPPGSTIEGGVGGGGIFGNLFGGGKGTPVYVTNMPGEGFGGKGGGFLSNVLGRDKENEEAGGIPLGEFGEQGTGAGKGAGKGLLSSLLDWAKGLFDGLKETLTGLFGMLKDGLSELIQWVVSGLRIIFAGGMHTGGLIAYHKGGFISDSNKESDNDEDYGGAFHKGGLSLNEVMIKAKKGEFVQQESAVKKYGIGFMNDVNKGTYKGANVGWSGSEDINAIIANVQKTSMTSLSNITNINRSPSKGTHSNSVSVTVPISISGGNTSKSLEVSLRREIERTVERVIKNAM